MLTDEEGLTQHIAQALEFFYHERKAPLPYLLIATGINGVTIVARYTEGEAGLDAEMLVFDENHGIHLPINMMLIDAAGEAAGMTFH